MIKAEEDKALLKREISQAVKTGGVCQTAVLSIAGEIARIENNLRHMDDVPGRKQIMRALERFSYRYAATVRFRNRFRLNITLGRMENAPLFPKGAPDNLFVESDLDKRNAAICSILSGLENKH